METGDFVPPGANLGIWRVIDASANRAGEALRVLEDAVRFVLDDARLTVIAKDLRHALATLLAHESLRDRWSARDVGGDVGIGVEPATTPPRRASTDLVAANAARAAQALRSLAECAAVVAPQTAAGFERLRYRLYELERGALCVARAQDRLAGIGLCVLIDGRADAVEFTSLVERLIGAGVRMLQVRDKRLGSPALVERVERALAAARRLGAEGRALVIVNDRADVAAATAADGVHTGNDDLPVPVVRRVVGPRSLVGRTAHTIEESRAAAAAGADYLGIGPCFPSSTKSFGRQAPREFLAAVPRECGLPLFAIGGITVERLDELSALGFTRVAVAAAITQAADPAAAAAAFISRLESLRPVGPS